VVGAWTDLAFSPVVNGGGLEFNAFGLDVAGLYIDPHDLTGNTVYAAISGFGSPAALVQQLYRSTDGGAHWTAIESNLPNVPVNAVVVDAEDTNTLYLGTDVGVFSTRAVATCSAAPCWAGYGSGLPLAPVTALIATHGGTAGLLLTAGTYGRGVWQIPQVTSGTPLTTATVSPASLTFASQTVGTTSAAQTVTLKNTGSATLTVTGVTVTGIAAADFIESDTCVGVPLAKNATCTLNVSFEPSASGARSGTLTIGANVAGGQLLLQLSGTGLAPANVTLLPASLSFGTQLLGTYSAPQSINVQNAGGSTVAISSLTVSAPFNKQTSTCGASLAANATCSVAVQFDPAVAGAATGSLTIVDGVGTQSASLTGTGVAQATDVLSATALVFPGTVLDQTSAPMTITLTNNGGVPLTHIGTSVQGAFSAVSMCGSQLAAAASCILSVEFTPTVAGTGNGSLVISDALRAQTVSLSGKGLKPASISLYPTAVVFGNLQVNTSGNATLTITNSGGSPLGTPGFSISGAGAASFAVGTSTCGASVAAGSSCTVQLIFTPVAAGTATATLTVSTTTQGVASAAATLSGTGLTPPTITVSPTALSLGSVIVGNSSNAYTVQVTNSGQVALAQPTFSVSGSQAADFALSAPADIPACTGSLNPKASCNIQVTFSPSLTGSETATLTVAGSNAIPPTATVALSGTGAASILLQASPSQLSFPAIAVGTVSPAQTLTVSNLGRQTANGLALSVTGPYQLSPALTNCKTTLARDSFCTIGLIFAPAASGDQPGALTISVSNLGVNPLAVPLDGTGVAIGGIQTIPTAITFGSIVVNTASAPQPLTVTNSGQAPLTGIILSTTGDFSLTANLCPATLAAQASCTTSVVFTPATTGIRTGTLTVITTSTGVPPAVVSLTGNGIPPGTLVANPSVVSFGAVTVGQTSPAQTVNLTNNGATALAGLQLTAAGDFSLPQNGCGAQLAAAAMCSFTVAFSPTQPGTRIGSVNIQSATAGFLPVVVGLTGTGLPTVSLTVKPTSLAFGSVAVGTDSAAMQLTITNPGTGTLAGLAFSTAAPFSIGTGSCGTSLSSGASCMVPVTFAPKVAGPQSGMVTVSSTSLGVFPVLVGLTGTGLTPASLSLTPAQLSFAATTIGTTSATQSVKITDTGGVGISGLTVKASGDFAVASSNCTATLAAGASCSVTVSFTPTAAGGRSGFLTAAAVTGATNTPVTASGSLSGTGLTAAVLTVSPTTLTFAPTQVGLTTPTQMVTVGNSGQSATTNLQLAVTAGFTLDPAKTTCTPVLAAGAHCTAGVIFAPTGAGAVTGSLTASLGGAAAGAATVALSGTGAPPPGISTNPASLVQFGTVGVGQSAAPIAVTVTNLGGLTALTALTLSVNAAGTASGFALTANTCLSTLAAAASCTVNVTFTPSAAGALTGALTISSVNGGKAVILALSGAGFDFKFAVVGSASATVIQGQSANYTLAVTPLGGSSTSVYNFACANIPKNTQCLFNPAQLPAQTTGVSGQVFLSIGTGGTATNARKHDDMRPETALMLCALFALPLALLRRRRSAENHNKSRPEKLFFWLLLIASAGSAIGCAGSGGGGSGGQGHNGGDTPTGTYTLPVTATSDGVAHIVSITLVVD
jgi:hypothetical protein